MQEVDRFRHHSGGIDQAAWSRGPARHGVRVRPQREPRNGQIGNATLSRFPIVDQTNTHLPNQPGRRALRGLLHTDIEVGETVVSIFNTHLQTGLRQPQAAPDAGRRAAGGGRPAADDPRWRLQRRRRPRRDGAGPALPDPTSWAGGAGPAPTAPRPTHTGRIDYVLLLVRRFVPGRPRAPSSRPCRTTARWGPRSSLPGDGDEVCVPVLDGPVQAAPAVAGDGWRTPVRRSGARHQLRWDIMSTPQQSSTSGPRWRPSTTPRSSARSPSSAWSTPSTSTTTAPST